MIKRVLVSMVASERELKQTSLKVLRLTVGRMVNGRRSVPFHKYALTLSSVPCGSEHARTAAFRTLLRRIRNDPIERHVGDVARRLRASKRHYDKQTVGWPPDPCR
jgi:hypothetical protein